MEHCVTDADPTSVREKAELEKLPVHERAGWAKFWAGVRDLQDATGPASDAPRPVK
jgi:hypothetical protein